MDESTSILDGTPRLIDDALRVKSAGKGPIYYTNKDACVNCSSRPTGFHPRALVEQLFARIEQNWSERPKGCPSKSEQNWRWQCCVDMALENESPEVRLERDMINAQAAPVGSDGIRDWANQVPVASGLLGRYADRRMAVDLAHRCPEHANCYALIELKLKEESGTPLYAAFEILRYGLLFLFFRCHREELQHNTATSPLLTAQRLHLRVLAPDSYYVGSALAWLEEDLNAALKSFARDKAGLAMDFSFWSCPSTLTPQEWLKYWERGGRPYAITTKKESSEAEHVA